MFIALDKLTAVKMYDLITFHWKNYVEQIEKDVAKSKYGIRNCWKKAVNFNG
jgi:type I restriction enzyme R subunit